MWLLRLGAEKRLWVRRTALLDGAVGKALLDGAEGRRRFCIFEVQEGGVGGSYKALCDASDGVKHGHKDFSGLQLASLLRESKPSE